MKSSRVVRPERPEHILRTALIIVIALILARLAASFMPTGRVWGLNQAAFVHGLWLFYIVVLAAVLLVYRHGLRQSSSAPIEAPPAAVTPLTAAIVSISIILLSALAFYFLSVNVPLLGDGLALLAGTKIVYKMREYGEMLIHKLALNLIGPSAAEPMRAAYRTVAITAGIVYTTAVVFYSRKMFQSLYAQAVFVAIGLTTGYVLQFYGYIENYSLTITVISLTLLSAAAALHNGRKSILPFLLYAGALFFHVISMVFAPAVAFYLILTFAGDKVRRLLLVHRRAVVIILMAGAVAFYAAIRTWGTLFMKVAVLPPLRWQYTNDNYYLLSGSHLADVANLILLIVPAGAAIGSLYLFSRPLRRSLQKEDKATMLFWLTAVIGGLAGAMVVEPKLGMARDWDLMSTMLVGAGLGAGYIAARMSEITPRLRFVAGMLILLNIAAFVPTLAVHKTPDSLYRYTLSTLELDLRHGWPGFFALRKYQLTRGDSLEAARLSDKMSAYYPEHDFNRQGGAALRRGDLAGAESLFRRAIALNPQWGGAYRDLGLLLLKARRYSESFEWLAKADAFNPYNADIAMNMGQACQLMGDTAAAVRYWQKSLGYNDAFPEAHLLLGEYYALRHRPDSALYYLTRLPDSLYPVRLYYSRGLAYLFGADTAKALENFDIFLQRSNDASLTGAVVKLENAIQDTRRR